MRLAYKKTSILYGLEAASGGALKHLVYLATHLDKDFFDITIVLSPRSSEAERDISELTALGIKIVQIPMCRNVSVFKDLISLVRIIKYLYINKFDIVHAHSSKAGVYFRIASWINRVPSVIYTPHCFFFQSKRGIKRSIFELIERFLGSLTHKIIVSENEMKQCTVSKIVPSSKLININNAINFRDYFEYDRESSLERFYLSKDTVVIGAVGRLVEQKDLFTFLFAARRLLDEGCNVFFVIAGDGDMETNLKKEIISLDIQEHVHLMGHCPDIARVFSAIDIFVSTSLWEGLPYVLLEAMWYKKPVVATDLGYNESLFGKDDEYLIQPGDFSALCEKLKGLVKDKRLRDSIGVKNRSKIRENFSFLEFVRAHEKLYLEIPSDKNIY